MVRTLKPEMSLNIKIVTTIAFKAKPNQMNELRAIQVTHHTQRDWGESPADTPSADHITFPTLSQKWLKIF